MTTASINSANDIAFFDKLAAAGRKVLTTFNPDPNMMTGRLLFASFVGWMNAPDRPGCEWVQQSLAAFENADERERTFALVIFAYLVSKTVEQFRREGWPVVVGSALQFAYDLGEGRGRAVQASTPNARLDPEIPESL